MKVNWTPTAVKTFERIIDWLFANWTKKEIEQFVEQTEQTIHQIEKNPYSFKASNKKKQVRKGFINELVSVFYRVRKNEKEIDILAFWDNRQNPKKNKYD